MIHLPLNIGKRDSTCGFALNKLKNCLKIGISTIQMKKRGSFKKEKLEKTQINLNYFVIFFCIRMSSTGWDDDSGLKFCYIFK